jgi:hypothetical protein
MRQIIYERDGLNIEGLNDGWITYLVFLVAVTGFLNKVNKQRKSKNKLITKIKTTSGPSKYSFQRGKTN